MAKKLRQIEGLIQLGLFETATNQEAVKVTTFGYVEPDKDGITCDRIETIQVETPQKSNVRMQIYVVQADSGSWYVGIHFHSTDCGHSYYPYPKFSEKFSSRLDAVLAGVDLLIGHCQSNEILAKHRREMKEALSSLSLFKNSISVVVEHSETEELDTMMVFSRTGTFEGDEAKLLLAGFDLLSYDRELKCISRVVADQAGQGWNKVDDYQTYAAAERAVKDLLQDTKLIQVSAAGRVENCCHKKLTAAGFEFYRPEGIIPTHGTPRIKCLSKNWGTWKKYVSQAEVETAWNKLMTDPKALEG